MFSRRYAPDYWRPYFAAADEAAEAGGRMFIQVHSRSLNLVLSFETYMPYDKLPMWREMRQWPLAEQEAALRDPDMRHQLVAAANQQNDDGGQAVGPAARTANYEYLFVMDKPLSPHRSVAEIAREQNKNPVDVVIDAALDQHMKQFFLQPIANEDQDHVLEMIRHPRSV